MQVYLDIDIVRLIKINRLRWRGHVQRIDENRNRMDENRIPKRLLKTILKVKKRWKTESLMDAAASNYENKELGGLSCREPIEEENCLKPTHNSGGKVS